MYNYDNISLKFLKLEIFQTNVVEKIKIHILYSVTFSESRAVYEVMCKNMVQPDRPQMIIQYGASALHAG
jgi:hypothetical protein